MSEELKKSISDEICENIQKHGFLPIPVQTLNEEAEASRYFAGTFSEFLEAAKALNAKGIFVETLYLDEDEFYYDSGIEEDDDEDDYYYDCDCDCDCDCDESECTDEDLEKSDCECECSKEDLSEDSDEGDENVWIDPEDLDGLDLSLLRPEIANYQDRIGESCGVRLTIPGVDHVEVEIFAEWYNTFAEMVDNAYEAIEIDPAAALEEMKANCNVSED
jgi:hypothetical protein